MISSFFKSRHYRVYAWSMLGFLSMLVAFSAYLTRQFNDWYKVFYDSLENKDYDAFLESFVNRGDFMLLDVTTWGFVPLALLAILLYTYISYLGNRYSFRWREAITYSYLPKWKYMDSHTEGASQRIQEDTLKFSAYVWTLGQGLLKAIMILIFFIPVLWELSTGFGIPGYLVWIALVASIGGLGVSVLVGRKLPQLEYNNQKIEAAFRKSLVRCEDSKDSHELEHLFGQFSDLKYNYYKLYNNYKYYSLWENLYFQAGVVIPYLVSAPQYFAGLITLGTLVQIGNAFGKIHDSMSFFTDNWLTVTELRSVIRRLTEFEKDIDL
jgi:peptide/bleomycin uptake transporter